MNLPLEFKSKVHEAILTALGNYTGSEKSFAKSIGINNASVFSRLKNGELEKVITDADWLSIARILNVSTRVDNWKVARTKVYEELERNLNFCQEYSKSMILIDECGIGKTYCTRHIMGQMKNAFYIDCSQGKTRQQFIRLIARTVGIESKGRYADVKANLKYYLNNVLVFPSPLIALDDAGYLDYPAFLELQELWNGTEDSCGWYMIGDSSLQHKIERGINRKRIGYKAIFSRFLDEYITISPLGKEDKKTFYKELIGAVASVNIEDQTEVPNLIKKCIKKETTLRYLTVLIQLLKKLSKNRN